MRKAARRSDTIVDVAGEVARAQTGLGDVPVTVLDGRDGRPSATLAHLADTLRSGPHVLAITCHGTIVEGEPYLYLAGDKRPIPGAELVRQLADLHQRPLLVILNACQSGGDGYATLAALGPQLARIGIGVVLAMQGDVPHALVATLMPRLFTELRRDGQIDRAMAAARAALPADQPCWQPVLWMAVKDGALWRTPEAPAVHRTWRT
jgi:CHAT domain-containing protein